MLRASPCGQPFGGVARPDIAAQRCRLSASAARCRGGRLQVYAGLQDPWATLGVPQNATEKEIKKAHRKLVLQHHPDVKANDPLANARFLRIQEAYELVLGKRQGKEIDQRPSNQSSWDFHDWYWSFSMKRRAQSKGKGPFAGAAGGAQAPPPDGPAASTWRSQMAGLKQKAAAKRWGQQRGGRRAQAAPSEDIGAAAGTGAPAAAAEAQAAAAAAARESARRESVWRSMTRNARASEQPAPQQAAAQQELGRSGSAAPQAVGSSSTHSAAPPPPPPPPAASARTEAAAAVNVAAAAPEQAPIAEDHTAPVQHSVPADKAHSSHHSAAAPTSGSEPHTRRLQRLMAQAAALHQGVRHGAEAHTQRLGAHAAAAGRHLRSRLSLEQLAALLGRAGGLHRHGAHEEPAAAGNAVPADSQLHHRFEATRLRRLREQQHAQEQAAEQHAAAAAHAAGGQGAAAAASEGQAAQEAQQHSSHAAGGFQRGASHARKFANREEVEGRLSSQLAGLKRRAALKHEVPSSF